MKFDKIEIALVEEASEGKDVAVLELNDMQLALVGGGGGEVVFH